MRSLALIGGGGFAKEVAEVAEANGYQVADYYADTKGNTRFNYLGYLPELLVNKGKYDGVALAIGGVNRRNIAARKEIIRWLDENGFLSPTLISTHAIVHKSVVIGPGSYVAHAAIIAEDARIGRFALLNTNAMVGHDTIVGDNVTLSPLAFIGGGATIGDDSLIGAGARVLQGAKIGTDALVGMGCTVLRIVKDHQTLLPKL